MLLLPPNSTVRLRARSKAIAEYQRTGGDVAGDSCVQLRPFQRQVSPSTVPPSEPPNSSVPPVVLS